MGISVYALQKAYHRHGMQQRPSRRAADFITLDMLRQHFDKPFQEAANALGVSGDILRSGCRRNGVTEWPCRHLQVLRKWIQALEEAARDAVDPDTRAEYVKKLKQMQLDFSAWQSRGAPRRRDSTAPLTESITLDMLRPLFDKTLAEAAEVMGITPQTFRKVWRRNGLTRWPYRPLLALRTRIKETEDAHTCSISIHTADLTWRSS